MSCITLLMMAMILVTSIVSVVFNIPIILGPTTYDAEINAIAAARSNIPNIRSMLLSKRQELDMLLDIQKKIKTDGEIEVAIFEHGASDTGRNPGIVVSFYRKSQQRYDPVEYRLGEVEYFDAVEKTAVRAIFDINVNYVLIGDYYLGFFLAPADPVQISVTIDKGIFNYRITGPDFYRENAYDDWYIELQY